jgi:hypothetical protein
MNAIDPQIAMVGVRALAALLKSLCPLIWISRKIAQHQHVMFAISLLLRWQAD